MELLDPLLTPNTASFFEKRSYLKVSPFPQHLHSKLYSVYACHQYWKGWLLINTMRKQTLKWDKKMHI